MSEPPGSGDFDVLVAVDELDDLIHNARAMPLSDNVRIHPDELNAAVARVREGAEVIFAGAEARTLGIVAQLEEVAREAIPVPLLREVRVDRERVYELLDQIRANIPDDIRILRGDGPAPDRPLPDSYLALDVVDDLVRDARTAPLSDMVRFDPAELSAAVERVRSAVVLEGASAALPIVDRLRDMIDTAKKVPFSSDIKLDREELYDVIDVVRAEL
jgi:hypothetical protein